MLRPKRTVIGKVILAVLILLLTPAVWNLAATKYQHVRSPVPGAFYDIEGRQMHIYCTGSGPYTVLIEVGASADSDSWRGIQETLSQKTRVCTYDRNGHGWSAPSPGQPLFSAIFRAQKQYLQNLNDWLSVRMESWNSLATQS